MPTFPLSSQFAERLQIMERKRCRSYEVDNPIKRPSTRAILTEDIIYEYDRVAFPSFLLRHYLYFVNFNSQRIIM